MPLTDTAIKNLKPDARSYKVADFQGLYVEVMPNGSKLWRLKYRFQGLEKRLSMGRYPEVGLREARRMRDNARALIAADLDPSLERKRAKQVMQRAMSITFGSIGREYIDKKMIEEGRAQATVAKAEWLLQQMRSLQPLPVGDIKPGDVLEALKRIEARGKRETARRCRSLASRIFRYAVATLRAESDPSAVLKGALIAPRVRHHAAITDPAKVGELLRAIDAYEGHEITRLAMSIAPHVMTRPGELRQARWDEVDIANAVWKIPVERMKMRKPHAVPLSRQVIGHLEALFALTGPDGFLFPAFHTFKRPMSENTMNQVLRRLGYGKDEMTSHGWRTTAATLLNESGKWASDAVERSLAHGDRNAIRGAYVRGDYWAERVQMHQFWSDYLDILRRGNVCDRASAAYAALPAVENVISMTEWSMVKRG